MAHAPRRLAGVARQRQLVAAAIPVAARQGLAALSLEGVAHRAGVTRNLLYHYFPRGRADLALAVVQEAERQLTSSGVGPAGLAGWLDHALAPTHAWRIHRLAAGAVDPELRAALAEILANRIGALSSAHLNTEHPPPLIETALRGYLGFAEAALEFGRGAGLSRSELAGLLDHMLAAALGIAPH